MVHARELDFLYLDAMTALLCRDRQDTSKHTYLRRRAY